MHMYPQRCWRLYAQLQRLSLLLSTPIPHPVYRFSPVLHSYLCLRAPLHTLRLIRTTPMHLIVLHHHRHAHQVHFGVLSPLPTGPKAVLQTLFAEPPAAPASAPVQQVAVHKMLAAAADNFAAEASLLLDGLGRHPHLLQALGLCKDGPDQLMVTEYAALGALDKLIERLDEEEDATVPFPHKHAMLNQVTSGMQAMAAENLVHRGLTTGSVLVFNFDAGDVSKTLVKVADFSSAISTAARNNAACEKLRVNQRHLAPETLKKESYSEKSDVWAFGVLAWQLLTDGSKPYYLIPDNSEVVLHVLGGGRLAQPPRHECPDEALWDAVESCWLVPKKFRPTFAGLAIKLLGQLSVSTPAGKRAVARQLDSVAADRTAIAQIGSSSLAPHNKSVDAIDHDDHYQHNTSSSSCCSIGIGNGSSAFHAYQHVQQHDHSQEIVAGTDESSSHNTSASSWHTALRSSASGSCSGEQDLTIEAPSWLKQAAAAESATAALLDTDENIYTNTDVDANANQYHRMKEHAEMVKKVQEIETVSVKPPTSLYAPPFNGMLQLPPMPPFPTLPPAPSMLPSATTTPPVSRPALKPLRFDLPPQQVIDTLHGFDTAVASMQQPTTHASARHSTPVHQLEAEAVTAALAATASAAATEAVTTEQMAEEVGTSSSSAGDLGNQLLRDDASTALETRVDSSDGESYSQEEFEDLYGGLVEWDAAAVLCDDFATELQSALSTVTCASINDVSRDLVSAGGRTGTTPPCSGYDDRFAFLKECETRVDSDGKRYSKREFYDCYNGLGQWNAAGQQWADSDSTRNDWTCSSKQCSFENFRKRTTCKDCGLPRYAYTSGTSKVATPRARMPLQMGSKPAAAAGGKMQPTPKKTKTKTKKKKKTTKVQDLKGGYTVKDIKTLLKTHQWEMLAKSGGCATVYKFEKPDKSVAKVSINWKDLDAGKDVFEFKRKFKEILEKTGVTE